MVKRKQHIGTFLRNEMAISVAGISPMCGRSSMHRQENLFLKIYISRGHIVSSPHLAIRDFDARREPLDAVAYLRYQAVGLSCRPALRA